MKLTLKIPTEDLRFLKYLFCIYIIISFISLLSVSYVFHPKILILHNNFTLTLTGATFIIPIAFFTQNVITEVYGYPESRKLTHMTVKLLVFLLLLITLFKNFLFTSSHNQHIKIIRYLNSTNRHILSFILASFIGLLLNDYVISKLKILFLGKNIEFRFLLSSMIGEAAFMSCGFIAWHGYLNEISQVLPLVIISYTYRILFICLTLPVSSMLCKKLKDIEGVDAYDFDISYNPFKFK